MSNENNSTDWCPFQGDGKVKELKLPSAPPWRSRENRIKSYCTFSDKVKKMVSAALILRRPLLITGNPGTGKSSLAEAIRHELNLGDEVLYWRIGTQSKLKDGLYSYDALSRLQDTQLENKEVYKKIENYLNLEALGKAFTSEKQRIVLIDEIDKSPIDLPNNLLHIFEENQFEIPEIRRLKDASFENGEGFKSIGTDGVVKCDIETFPLIIMTSNGERDFPSAFMRRCLHLKIEDPTSDELLDIVNSHFEQIKVPLDQEKLTKTIKAFITLRDDEENETYLATDQLLNAVYLMEEDNSIDLADITDEMRLGIWKNLLG